MKAIPTTLAAGALLLVGLALPVTASRPTAPPQDLEARVSALEGELAKATREHEKTRARLDATLAYLEKQSKAAQALLTSFDRSEELGFTAGINYQSREVLLSGLRAFCRSAGEGLPQGAPPAKPAQEADPRAPRRPVRQTER